MSLGYSAPLYALPCDQGPALVGGVFGWQAPLDAVQQAQLASVKSAMYAAFRRAISATLARRAALIVVDPDEGTEIFRHAAGHGFLTAMPLSGDGELDVDAVPATFAKLSVRADDCDRLRQRLPPRARQRQLLVELLGVPRHPEATLRAIKRLQDTGVEPDVWLLEPLSADSARLAAALARRDGRDGVGCMVLVRGDGASALGDLQNAAAVPGFIGFSVDPAVFRADVEAWRAGLSTWDALVTQVAERYRAWIEAFEHAAREAGSRAASLT
jgi:Uncharacterized protein conserved in bacteria (DUF2090)